MTFEERWDKESYKINWTTMAGILIRLSEGGLWSGWKPKTVDELESHTRDLAETAFKVGRCSSGGIIVEYDPDYKKFIVLVVPYEYDERETE